MAASNDEGELLSDLRSNLLRCMRAVSLREQQQKWRQQQPSGLRGRGGWTRGGLRFPNSRGAARPGAGLIRGPSPLFAAWQTPLRPVVVDTDIDDAEALRSAGLGGSQASEKVDPLPDSKSQKPLHSPPSSSTQAHKTTDQNANNGNLHRTADCTPKQLFDRTLSQLLEDNAKATVSQLRENNAKAAVSEDKGTGHYWKKDKRKVRDKWASLDKASSDSDEDSSSSSDTESQTSSTSSTATLKNKKSSTDEVSDSETDRKGVVAESILIEASQAPADVNGAVVEPTEWDAAKSLMDRRAKMSLLGDKPVERNSRDIPSHGVTNEAAGDADDGGKSTEPPKATSADNPVQRQSESEKPHASSVVKEPATGKVNTLGNDRSVAQTREQSPTATKKKPDLKKRTHKRRESSSSSEESDSSSRSSSSSSESNDGRRRKQRSRSRSSRRRQRPTGRKETWSPPAKHPRRREDDNRRPRGPTNAERRPDDRKPHTAALLAKLIPNPYEGHTRGTVYRPTGPTAKQPLAKLPNLQRKHASSSSKPLDFWPKSSDRYGDVQRKSGQSWNDKTFYPGGDNNRKSWPKPEPRHQSNVPPSFDNRRSQLDGRGILHNRPPVPFQPERVTKVPPQTPSFRNPNYGQHSAPLIHPTEAQLISQRQDDNYLYMQPIFATGHHETLAPTLPTQPHRSQPTVVPGPRDLSALQKASCSVPTVASPLKKPDPHDLGPLGRDRHPLLPTPSIAPIDVSVSQTPTIQSVQTQTTALLRRPENSKPSPLVPRTKTELLPQPTSMSYPRKLPPVETRKPQDLRDLLTFKKVKPAPALLGKTTFGSKVLTSKLNAGMSVPTAQRVPPAKLRLETRKLANRLLATSRAASLLTQKAGVQVKQHATVSGRLPIQQSTPAAQHLETARTSRPVPPHKKIRLIGNGDSSTGSRSDHRLVVQDGAETTVQPPPQQRRVIKYNKEDEDDDIDRLIQATLDEASAAVTISKKSAGAQASAPKTRIWKQW